VFIMSALFSPLRLPCGASLPNRLAKAAMEEQLAAPGQLPSDAQIRLYETWAKGGTGLLISGNVMVDPRW
jgi:2,4-dienoyl-CoA reductase-like NADH-dependent reductase (Old Yellow Enzyme family)